MIRGFKKQFKAVVRVFFVQQPPLRTIRENDLPELANNSHVFLVSCIVSLTEIVELL